jgi:hypothetical protein
LNLLSHARKALLLSVSAAPPTAPCAPQFEGLAEAKVMSSGDFGVV